MAHGETGQSTSPNIIRQNKVKTFEMYPLDFLHLLKVIHVKQQVILDILQFYHYHMTVITNSQGLATNHYAKLKMKPAWAILPSWEYDCVTWTHQLSLQLWEHPWKWTSTDLRMVFMLTWKTSYGFQGRSWFQKHRSKTAVTDFMLLFTINVTLKRAVGWGGNALQKRKEWPFIWELPRVLSGEVQHGQHKVTEGNWLLRVRKNTEMSRGQPEGALRTENLAGAKGNLQSHQLKSDLSLRTCLHGHSRQKSRCR